MTERDATVDDVIETHESASPDHHEHAKQPKHVDEANLERRLKEERASAAAEES